MGKEKDEKVSIYGPAFVRIKHSGLYDIEQLIGDIKGWVFSKKYIPAEEEHTENVKPAGKEIRYVISPLRNVTDYIRFAITVEISIYREMDVVLEEETGKTPKQRGDLEVRVKATMIKNYKSTFRGASKEFLRRTYEKYLIKSQLEEYEQKLKDDVDELLDIIKASLQAHRR